MFIVYTSIKRIAQACALTAVVAGLAISILSVPK
jgi:hypothetical protein